MRTPPLTAVFFTLISVMILCALGSWQIQRLHWKEDLLKEIDAVWSAPPALLNAANILREHEAGKRFLYGSVQGVFLQEKSIRVAPRVLNEQQGAHLIMPFQLDDGAVIFVNRGWVPLEKDKTGAGHSATMHQSTRVTGMLRLPDDPNYFTPKNIPEKNMWYTIAPDEIAKPLNLKGVLPLILVEQAQNKMPDGKFPIAIGDKPHLNNNHLSYALFWFSMAGILIGIFILRFVTLKPPL